ncbi:MAG: hypothetical protein AAF933_07930 [Pseudomonadota bacterium]
MKNLVSLTANAALAATVSLAVIELQSPEREELGPDALIASAPVPAAASERAIEFPARTKTPPADFVPLADPRIDELEILVAELGRQLNNERQALSKDELELAYQENLEALDQNFVSAPHGGSFSVEAEADLWASSLSSGDSDGQLLIDTMSCRSDQCLLSASGVSEASLNRFSAGIPWDSAVEFHPAAPESSSGRVIVTRRSPALDDAAGG